MRPDNPERRPGSFDAKLTYGDDASQFVRLYYPTTTAGKKKKKKVPCVVIVHGGFWKEKFGVDNAAIESLAPDIADRGFVAAEVEYRRPARWPGSCEDVEKALRLVAEDARVDERQLVLLGHSAGGHSALVVAQTTGLPRLTVAVAPVADLVEAFDRRLSSEGDAASSYLGGASPSSDPDLYAAASPARSMLPPRTSTLVVTGARDEDVPPELTRRYVDAVARAEEESSSHNDDDATRRVVRKKHTFLELPVADHYTILDAQGPFWGHVWQAIVFHLDSVREPQQDGEIGNNDATSS